MTTNVTETGDGDDDRELRAVDRAEKIEGLRSAAQYRPRATLLIVLLGIATAVLEGVGLTFIIPIIELLQTNNPAENANGFMRLFVVGYSTLGIPFTLTYVIGGVAVAMVLRYTSAFLLHWSQAALQQSYERNLRRRLFESAIESRIEFIDEEGPDSIINSIITEASYSGMVIRRLVNLLELSFIVLVYLVVALSISPLLTLGSIFVLGAITLVLRNYIGSGYTDGDIVASANERLQKVVQAAMIGVREVRIFNVVDEMIRSHDTALQRYTESKVAIARNRAALSQFQNLAVSLFVFALVYVAVVFANLSFGELGLFLFVMFQLGPRVSTLNERFYKVEEALPHVVRTRRMLGELDRQREPTGGERAVPEEVTAVAFEDVRFGYDEEDVIRGIDFQVEKGEFVAFVGQSGAGKSTLVSLLARFYDPRHGRITANGEPITEMQPSEWRKRLAIVRQDPTIFNDTLRYNLTLGDRAVSDGDVAEACRIARVDEFIDRLPDGYDSYLGDDGVRLSGGQKQRVALARALLADADLLILDEATSDLDSNIEREVQRGIESMDRDYAIIAIAHRLSTVENADRIYTMVDGRISEQGRHTELVANGGKYAELYGVQS